MALPKPIVNDDQNRVLIKPIGYWFKVKTVKKLENIPPMFSYYESESKKSDGLYCCLIPNVYVKIPFAKVIDSTMDYGRIRSVKCKYGTKQQCDEQRNKMSYQHNREIRVCNFAHQGEKIVKIGYPSRCQKMPNFGNTNTLISDIKILQYSDVKNILFYGLNDIFSSAVWMDCNGVNKKIINDLDYA